MRILIFDESLAPIGGVEVQTLFVCRELARRGHEIDLVYLQDGELHSEFQEVCRKVTQVPTFRFSRKRPIHSGRRLVSLIRAVLSSRPDVICVQRTGEIAGALVAGRLARAPVVCHLHGFRSGGCGRRKGSQVAKFIAVSNFIKDKWVAEGLEPSWIEVVHNGVEPTAYPFGGAEMRGPARRMLGLPEGGFLALFYGRLEPIKGVEVLLDAWKLLKLDPKDNRLLLVGSAASDAEGAAYEKSLLSRDSRGCHWSPSRRDVITPLHAADVVVVPSKVEAFPRAVIEALATGRPVVAARTGGIPEMLKGEFSRFLFIPGDSASLADRLQSVVAWREREPALAQACTAHVLAHFTGQVMVDGLEEIFQMAAREH
ncbi:MAG TPA: glycosyltransferase family 4 protein [Acidimicrobiales bacterium]|nr:glycosyltransferase family 4 protein [Acidimicrobiales bacterium]